MSTLTNRGLRTAAAAAVSVAAVLAAAPSASAVTKLTHSQATTMLRNAGITWSSSGNCSNRNISTCTSFEQVNKMSIDGIITFKRASGCSVNITGGTEVGHASGVYSHYNGYKIDTSITTCINNWITSTYTYIGTRGDGARQYRAASGNIYAKESNHWDITYYSCGGC